MFLFSPGLLLVTTPFSLVRLLSCHCFMFLRLYHLVLDEADQLFALAPDQVNGQQLFTAATELQQQPTGCVTTLIM